MHRLVAYRYKYIVPFCILISFAIHCAEDKYTDDWDYTYNNSPQNEVYIEITTDDFGEPTGKLEFDHGSTDPDDWFPATSFYMDKYEFPNQEGSMPIVNVTWFEARDFCEAQFVDLNGNGVQDDGEKNKRLCDSSEWKETCRGRGVNLGGELDGMWGFGSAEAPEGTKDFHFPYGGNGQSTFWREGACNDDTNGVAESGSYDECVNPNVGTTHPYQADPENGWDPEPEDTFIYDLTGNVWEWVDFDYYGALPSEEGAEDCALNDGTNPEICRDDYLGQSQMLGGYYYSAKFANCNRSFILPSETVEVKIGFRCCRD